MREKKNDKSKDYCKGDRYFRYFIYLPHDYNNYNKMPKKKKNVGRDGEEA